MRIELVTGDITAEQVDAVVNAANSSLLGGEETTVEVARLVLFDEQTRGAAERVYQSIQVQGRRGA